MEDRKLGSTCRLLGELLLWVLLAKRVRRLGGDCEREREGRRCGIGGAAANVSESIDATRGISLAPFEACLVCFNAMRVGILDLQHGRTKNLTNSCTPHMYLKWSAEKCLSHPPTNFIGTDEGMTSFSTSSISALIIVVAAWISSFQAPLVECFQVNHRPTPLHRRNTMVQMTTADDDNGLPLEEPIEEVSSAPPIQGMEKAWRYIKKPLLSIGSKGASASHGNSLRQLLQSHKAVKVKVVNTQVFPVPTLDGAFEQLRDLAVAAGAPPGIELLQVRVSERILLIGWPGMREQIGTGEFPPAPIVWNAKKDDSE
jgi:hypothetical protein